jgi:tyrosine-specific transport protein
MERKSSILGGALLVAGTTIGGGMLALPVITALGGFLPAVIIYFFIWAFMCCTGLLFVELSLSFNGEPNIVSMAKNTLGRYGKILAWVLYLFLFYGLTTAYVAGGGELVQEVFVGLPQTLSVILFSFGFGSFVYIGTRAVERVNTVMMIGLGISYLVFVVFGFAHVDTERLLYRNWGQSLVGVSVILTSFGFQGFVPSLCAHMKRQAHRIKLAIIIGSAVPFLVYIVWEGLILGVVPLHGAGGLADAMEQGNSVVTPLKAIIDSPWIHTTSEFFAFFALTTSFLGVTLGLLDFLADGFSIKKTWRSKFSLCLLIYVPASILAISGTRVFLVALKYAGAYGVAVLLVLLPIAMTWVARYNKKIESEYRFWGGKKTLAIMAVFAVIIILIGAIA